MDQAQTVDDLLEQLLKLKRQVGGNCPVRLSVDGGLFPPLCAVAATAKNDDRKLVSRGGSPCVVIGM